MHEKIDLQSVFLPLLKNTFPDENIQQVSDSSIVINKHNHEISMFQFYSKLARRYECGPWAIEYHACLKERYRKHNLNLVPFAIFYDIDSLMNMLHQELPKIKERTSSTEQLDLFDMTSKL